jgi:hypothetical protein
MPSELRARSVTAASITNGAEELSAGMLRSCTVLPTPIASVAAVGLHTIADIGLVSLRSPTGSPSASSQTYSRAPAAVIWTSRTSSGRAPAPHSRDNRRSRRCGDCAVSRPGRHGAPTNSRCLATGKVRFPDAMSTTRALHKAATARASAELVGLPTRRAECRKYHCQFYNGWHMTSQVQAGVSADDVRAGGLRDARTRMRAEAG